MPSKGAAVGPQGLGNTWSGTHLEPNGLTCPGHCAALKATCAGKGAGPRSTLARAGKVAVMEEASDGRLPGS